MRRLLKDRWGAETANYDVSLDGSRFLWVRDGTVSDRM